MKLKKGDKVRVLSGKDRGKEGQVMRAFPAQEKVIVEGVNVVKRHTRPTRAARQAGIIDKNMPLPASSVAVICSQCGPSRIGARFDEDQGRKVRVCRKCGADL